MHAKMKNLVLSAAIFLAAAVGATPVALRERQSGVKIMPLGDSITGSPGGFLALNIANQNLLPGWLAATTPDLILMHLGTNDVWNNASPSQITTAFSTLLQQMRAANPNVVVLVAQIIPMAPPNCAECGGRVVALNRAIAEWAPGVNTAVSPVVVVDCWTGFDVASMTGDGVHPNEVGDRRLADVWFEAVVEAIGGLS
ncbi:hypothetical protein J1614_004331 [Plenodomus biglobosus]|nr:hypothetical protein J1614_004331 [Plenodomus biglobosus]